MATAVKKFYQILQADRQADVYIYGDITPERWSESDVSAASFANQLRELDVDEIRVHIDSYGGSVSEGWAIYNALRQHPARVVTYGDGFVASAALYPFLAGDERIASSVSAYYLHQVSTAAFGYPDDLRKAADETEKMTEIGIQAFVERTGMTADEVRVLMESETWLAPQEALEKGIVTKIETADESALPYAQDARRSILQKVFAAQTEEKPEEKPSLMQALAKMI